MRVILIQFDRCAYKERKYGHKKEIPGGYSQAEKRPLEEAARGHPAASQRERPQRKPSHPCQNLDLGCPASRTGRKLISSSSPWHLVIAAWADECYSPGHRAWQEGMKDESVYTPLALSRDTSLSEARYCSLNPIKMQVLSPTCPTMDPHHLIRDRREASLRS